MDFDAEARRNNNDNATTTTTTAGMHPSPPGPVASCLLTCCNVAVDLLILVCVPVCQCGMSTRELCCESGAARSTLPQRRGWRHRLWRRWNRCGSGSDGESLLTQRDQQPYSALPADSGSSNVLFDTDAFFDAESAGSPDHEYELSSALEAISVPRRGAADREM